MKAVSLFSSCKLIDLPFELSPSRRHYALYLYEASGDMSRRSKPEHHCETNQSCGVKLLELTCCVSEDAGILAHEQRLR